MSSHQAYPHKILTARRDCIRTIRKAGGLSGFTKRGESEFDCFGAAHSSTSISSGLGMAVGRDMLGQSNHVIAVIGDGAMSAGMAYEAINNAGAMNSRLIVILNDNDMSIAPATGALNRHLNTLAAEKTSEGSIFSALGMRHIGPVDGHDVDGLVALLEGLRDEPEGGPVLVHLRTNKGHGYAPAGQRARQGPCGDEIRRRDRAAVQGQARRPELHQCVRVGTDRGGQGRSQDRGGDGGDAVGHGPRQIRQGLSRALLRCGHCRAACRHLRRRLACEGLRPFAAIYSTFLQRAYDQVVHDVAIQNLPVRFAMDRAGLVGADGCTHAGAFDIAYLGCLPNMVVMAAGDEAELMHMVATAAAYDEGPIAFRYPRGEGTGIALPARGEVLEIGKGRVLREGSDVAILSFGTRLSATLKAAASLERQGISCTVADARFAKPLDTALLQQLARHHGALVTIEEGAAGGFGAAVLSYLANNDLMGGLTMRTLTLPDRFQDHDDMEAQYAEAGLDAAGIAGAVAALFPARALLVQA